MEKVYLKIPSKQDLWFKKEMKEDPFTMDYNAGYNVSYNGYNYDNGTIDTDLSDLENTWFFNWINNFPSNYYAYIVETKSNKFVGEVYAKYHSSKSSYEIGIVIKGEFREKGYSKIAIKLLCENLKNLGVKKLFHEIPSTRISAIKADIFNGFVVVKENILCPFLKFGKQEYLTILEKDL